jgi:hypothetical protein
MQAYFSWKHRKKKKEQGEGESRGMKDDYLPPDHPALKDGRSYFLFLATQRGFRNNSTR